MKVGRALISVYDKTGIERFARKLHALGVEIVSTGGTSALLKKNGIPVTDVSSVTKFPEMLDGRVKTLHPKLHAGLLAIRDNAAHMKTLKAHKITPIDLLVVNLYPFWDAVKSGQSEKEIIEMIDIGGPAMLRAAAKNFMSVGIISDPEDYDTVAAELGRGQGSLSPATLKRLATKVFKLTSYYDALIYQYFADANEAKNTLPVNLRLDFEKIQDLRYGENPHQKGALYRSRSEKSWGVVKAKQLHGKELSFNNILDLDAALEMAQAFPEQPSCSIMKHTSPCGFALGKDAKEAYLKAHACDPLSAFGGIIGFNTTVDGPAAEAILAGGFVECIIAHGFNAQAVKVLKTKKNLRLLLASPEKEGKGFDFKKVRGGLLLQDRDVLDPAAQDLRVVTKNAPKDNQMADLLFAFKVCRYVKSNAIVVAKHLACLGLGMGQPSRVDACDVAFKKAAKRSRGAVLASDGFFPKPDSIQLARRHGITAIIQPGGSIQDEAVIRACNRAGIAMVFTGIRHFKH